MINAAQHVLFPKRRQTEYVTEYDTHDGLCCTTQFWRQSNYMYDSLNVHVFIIKSFLLSLLQFNCLKLLLDKLASIYGWIVLSSLRRCKVIQRRQYLVRGNVTKNC